MNKKKLAYFIQASLLIAIIIVGFSTYKALERDSKLLESKYIVDPNAACPRFQKRSCLMESYSTKPTECPIRPDECNSQNDLKFCFIYSWKNNRQNGNCHDCNIVNFDKFSDRVFAECKKT